MRHVLQYLERWIDGPILGFRKKKFKELSKLEEGIEITAITPIDKASGSSSNKLLIGINDNLHINIFLEQGLKYVKSYNSI